MMTIWSRYYISHVFELLNYYNIYYIDDVYYFIDNYTNLRDIFLRILIIFKYHKY